MEQYTLVVGMGKTGISCIRYLTQKGILVCAADSRNNPPGLQEVKKYLPEAHCFTGAFSEPVFAKAKEIIMSPGISKNTPLIHAMKQNGASVIGDIELFSQQAKAPVVAITGSNGKSTVTTLLGLMAEQSGLNVRVGGNIGIPALDILDEQAQLYILELSSFQLETTDSLCPQAAVVLNLSTDHMDRYPQFDDYVAAKAKIYQQCKHKIINFDDPIVMAMADENETGFTLLNKPANGIFGIRVNHHKDWICCGQDAWLPADALKIKGQHNLSNALAALALGQSIALEKAAMITALIQFPGLAHRTEWVAQDQGITWYNDSKATNVGACIAALKGLSGKSILIAGGEGKGADFKPLTQAIDEHARAVVLFGKDAKQIHQVISSGMNTVLADDLADAVTKASHLARIGDNILLSPACASFDLFDNFEHRGDVFKSLVKKMINNHD